GEVQRLAEKTNQFDIQVAPIMEYPFNLQLPERKALLKGADGALWAQILKQKNQFRLQVFLFDRQGDLFLKEEDFIQEEPTLSHVTQKMHEVLSRLFSRLPYQGWIIGKRGRLVTLNFGKNHGAQEGQEVRVVIVTHLRRHPVDRFVTEFEVDTVGRILIQKVDKEMSFGSLISERFENLVQVGMKIEAQPVKTYPPLLLTQEGTLVDLNRGNQNVGLILGDKFQEHVSKEPQFGRVTAATGFSHVDISNQLSIRGEIEGKNWFLPFLSLSGELWLTYNWVGELELVSHLGAINVTGVNIATPHLSYQNHLFLIGGHYRWYFGEEKENNFGYLGLRFFMNHHGVQETSSYDFTSYQGSGINLSSGIRYAFPDSGWGVLGFIDWPIWGHFSESPVTSGNPQGFRRFAFGCIFETFFSPRRSFYLGFKRHHLSLHFAGSGSRPETASLSLQDIHQWFAGLNFYF
ncbi:MAG: hypothetical protein NZ480_02625, partial [Bdellovibrionaceae bacterium]|nr:hypothetical protein [Pseudobdellovibrionaceae bacterium]